MEKKLDIAAIILTKNSSETIVNSVNSAKAVCRQIVVVDTGSEDNTPLLVTQLGTELHFFHWCNDFSKARNYALKFVRTEWILILDSDEELDINSYLEFLKNSQLKPNIGGIRVKIRNLLAKDNISTEHKYTRIFRNNNKFQFKGKIHEQIADSILENGFEIIDSEIQIYHWGYSINTEERAKRNKEMLEEEIKENQNDPWLKYHLAETEFSSGNFEKSFEIFKDIYISQFLTNEQKEISQIRLAQISLQKDDFESLIEFLDFNSTDKNREGLRLYILAIMHLLKKEYKKTQDIIDKFIVRESDLVPKEQLKNIENLLNQIK